MGSLIPDLGFLDFLFLFLFLFLCSLLFSFSFSFSLGNTNNNTEHLQNAKVKQAFSHRSFYFSLSDSPNEHTTKNTTTPLPGTDSQTKRPHTPPHPSSSHPYHTTSLPTYLPSSASVIHILPLFFFPDRTISFTSFISNALTLHNQQQRLPNQHHHRALSLDRVPSRLTLLRLPLPPASNQIIHARVKGQFLLPDQAVFFSAGPVLLRGGRRRVSKDGAPAHHRGARRGGEGGAEGVRTEAEDQEEEAGD